MYEDEVKSEKDMKIQLELINKKLKQQLEDLNKSQDQQKQLEQKKMDNVEQQFVEKQKIAMELMKKKDMEDQERKLSK